ncbi:hypothetical protein FR943_05085 [Mycobacterium sp. TNTM28]|uniref:Uncharacterized protein n=1 Tax=[Mycobacterium] fortunisiensis TaxID=2600579 RepID=A0ABS6KI86_9MYCO|nr:hypothetical protein [[Mycobacterium] fortunisiensis]MBU9763219.1 hypothetical protein [[Mycobacterium] fortunisiensis]
MKVGLPAILGALLFGATGILASVWIVVAVMRGEYLTAIVSSGFALACLAFSVPLLKVIRGSVFPRGEWGAEGTMIHPDRGIEFPVIIGTFGAVVASVLFTAFFPFGRLDIPVPSETRVLLPYLSGMLVLVSTPIVWRILRSGGIYWLQLTPDGFVVNAGGVSPRVGSWDQVVDVTDAVPGSTAADDPNTVVLVLEGDVVIKLPGAAFTPEGVALRRLVFFYWQHPLNRDELADNRAFDRLRSENFRAGS